MNPFDQIPAARAVPDGIVDRAAELLRVYVAKVGSAKASDPFLLRACLSLAASENAVPLSDSKDLQVKTKKQQQDFSKAMASLRNTVSSTSGAAGDAASSNQLNMALVAVGATQIPLRAIDAMVQHATQKLREDGTIQRIQSSLDEASLFKYQLAATYLIVEATKSAPSKASFAKAAKLPLTSFDAIVARMRLDCADLLERMVNPSTPKKRARESTDDGALEKENADELRDTDPLAPPSLSLTRPRSNVKRIKLDNAPDAVPDDGESPLRGRQARHPAAPTAEPDAAEDSLTRRRTSPRLAGKSHAMDVLASRTRPVARTLPRPIAVTVPVLRRSATATATPGTRLQDRMQQSGSSTPGRRAPQTPHMPSKLRLQTVPPTASTASTATPTSGPSTPLTPTTRAMMVPDATTPDDAVTDLAAAPTGTPTPHARRATATVTELAVTPSRPRRPRIAPATPLAAAPAAPAAAPAPLENVPGFGSFNMVPLVDPRESQRFHRFLAWKASMVERLQTTLAAAAAASTPVVPVEAMVV
ncbi:hypothetical protein GGF32_005274 [Allomyces javanicus]|nr:hypothetical protein GGF32_005274 [Allomyces javanicus]